MPPPHHHHHHPHHHHHHHERHADRWWQDLPESAVKAAKFLGYTQAIWDAGDVHTAAYDQKRFPDLTPAEKRAAVYLGKSPITYKLNSSWNDVDQMTQTHSKVLGWTQRLWDDGQNISDVECWNWWWQDASPEQRKALEYFGYNQNLWDQTRNEEDFDDLTTPSPTTRSTPEPKASTPEPNESSEEKKADEEKEEASPSKKGANKKKPTQKAKFSESPLFGGDSGDSFDHGNNFHIDAITVFADNNYIHGISVQYNGAKNGKAGSIPPSGENGKTLKLRKGEFVTAVKVRSTNKNVHSLTFLTNKGTKLGPCGGSKKGEEVDVRAPPGCVLCGLIGKSGKHVNAIGLKWGPSPAQR